MAKFGKNQCYLCNTYFTLRKGGGVKGRLGGFGIFHFSPHKKCPSN